MPHKDLEKRREYQRRYRRRIMQDQDLAEKEREKSRNKYRTKHNAKTRHDMGSKQKAIEEGRTRYFTGLPCKWGHTSERLVSNSACLQCLRERSKRNMEKPHHKEYKKSYDKWWRKTFPEKHCRKEAKRRAAKRNATPVWADQEQIDYIYWACQRVNEKFGTNLTVDHIVPLKGKNVCGLHVENNLQLLSLEENASKNNSWEVSDNR